jgi:catechol 2,3-dioxygenase-like lactoylglutathione lyase family enzyme
VPRKRRPRVRRILGVHATFTVTDFDHIVLNVSDTERALGFYCGQLGLEPVRVDEWRRHAAPFPSARVGSATIIDLVELPRRGENVDHFCLVVEPVDLEEVKRSGHFEVVDGPDRRFGARGEGTSLYIRDPDGNVVELRYY